jgi:lipoprotein-anchoring transpeptidase ErfK/SrfK
MWNRWWIAVYLIVVLVFWCGCGKEEKPPAPVLPDKPPSPAPNETVNLPQQPPQEPQPPQESPRPVSQVQPSEPPPKPQEPTNPSEPPQTEESSKKAFEEAIAETTPEKKRTLLKKVIETYPDSEEFYKASEALADIYASFNELYNAVKTLSDAYIKSDNEENRRNWAKKMEEWNQKVFFSFIDTPISQVYVVQAGDVLSKVGADFNVPYKFIMRMNGIQDERKIRVGDRIKIPVPKDKKKMEAFVQVDKSEHSLSIFINGVFLKRYTVGLGKDDRTPEGEFTIISKVNKPSWKGKPYGDPENIIGDWWLGFDETKFQGLGIHGTNDPSSIGKDVSEGCVRMTNADVDEVANTIPKDSKVVVRK